MRLFIQPAGGKESRRHFEDTIERPVLISRLRRFLPQTQTETLRRLYGSRAIPTWGLTPDLRTGDREAWRRMQPGDVVLFTGSNQAYAVGVVSYKIRNQELAKDLWSTGKDGRTWEFVYFLDQVNRVSIPYQTLRATFGYRPKFVPQSY